MALSSRISQHFLDGSIRHAGSVNPGATAVGELGYRQLTCNCAWVQSTRPLDHASAAPESQGATGQSMVVLPLPDRWLVRWMRHRLWVCMVVCVLLWRASNHVLPTGEVDNPFDTCFR